MIASYVGENKTFEKMYLDGTLELTPTMHKNLILPVDLKTVYPS